MKWRATEPKRNIGEKRKTKEFAWLPTLVDGYYVWLEDYWLVEEYTCHGWEEYTKWL